MAGNGYTVNTGSLTTASQSFSNAVAPMAQQVQAVGGALGVSTGDPALDALITRMATQVMDSVAGCGQAMQADATGLTMNAAMYTAADAASVPNIAAAPNLTASIFNTSNVNTSVLGTGG